MVHLRERSQQPCYLQQIRHASPENIGEGHTCATCPHLPTLMPLPRLTVSQMTS